MQCAALRYGERADVWTRGTSFTKVTEIAQELSSPLSTELQYSIDVMESGEYY